MAIEQLATTSARLAAPHGAPVTQQKPSPSPGPRHLQAAAFETLTHFPTTAGGEVEPGGTWEHGHHAWLTRRRMI